MDRFDFRETGTGPAVLFIPGSYSTSVAWGGVQKVLPDGYRVISTSLLGYGKTAETRTDRDFHMDHQVRLIESVIAQIGAPVHLVGHSFGGTIALAVALAGRADIRSVATFEANPFGLLSGRGCHDLVKTTRKLSQDFETAVTTGEQDAPRRIIDFWGGGGAFDALPGGVQDFCRQSAHTNILDWRTYYTFDAKAADFSRLKIPVLLACGARANPVIAEISGGLSECLPNARTATVDGAGHSLIVSHPQQCADLLVSHLDRALA